MESQDDQTDLLHELGLSEDEDFVTIQQESIAAEKWLEKRKDQERRDAVLARALQERLYEQPEPIPAPSISRVAPALSAGLQQSPSQATPRNQTYTPQYYPAHPYGSNSCAPQLSASRPLLPPNSSYGPSKPVSRFATDTRMGVVDLTGSNPSASSSHPAKVIQPVNRSTPLHHQQPPLSSAPVYDSYSSCSQLNPQQRSQAMDFFLTGRHPLPMPGTLPDDVDEYGSNDEYYEYDNYYDYDDYEEYERGNGIETLLTATSNLVKSTAALLNPLHRLG